MHRLVGMVYMVLDSVIVGTSGSGHGHDDEHNGGSGDGYESTPIALAPRYIRKCWRQPCPIRGRPAVTDTSAQSFSVTLFVACDFGHTSVLAGTTLNADIYVPITGGFFSVTGIFCSVAQRVRGDISTSLPLVRTLAQGTDWHAMLRQRH